MTMAGAMVGLWIVFSFTNFWAGFLIPDVDEAQW